MSPSDVPSQRRRASRMPRSSTTGNDGGWVLLSEQQLAGNYRHLGDAEDDHAEWVVPVEWLDARPETDAYWEKGMFASQHSACKLRQEFTLERLADHFGIDGDSG